MANYYGKIRTNYFEVKDKNLLASIIHECISDNPIELYSETIDGKEKYMFCCDGSILGIEVEDEEYSYDLFVDKLKSVIVEGDAIIILEVGSEKFVQLFAGASIITCDEHKYFTFKDYLQEKAKEILFNKDFAMRIDY